MEELVKHINDTNASYRAMGAGDAKNTDLFLDNEHYEFFKDSGDQITVRFNKENLSKAILFIASVLPRKYDNSAVHKTISYSSEFVLDQLAFLDGFFTVDGKRVENRIQKWNARKDVMKANGDIDKRFYFNGLLEDINYITYKGERKSAKFTIRNYFAGGYSDLHIRKANDGIFDIWITNTQTPYDDGKDKHHEIIDDQSLPLQQIFYGAPGTGKSFEIKEQTKDKDVIRTTFHPDSDYSTFVGAYKPIMEETDVRVVPVVLKNGASFDQNNGTYKEKRITYKFVKQAFLKAYLSAWKKYADSKCNNNPQLSKSFIIPTGSYTITSVEPNCIVLSRKFEFPKKFILYEWPNLWKSGSFVLPSGAQSGRSLEHAIAKWIYDHLEHCTVNSIEDGWGKLMSSIDTLGFVDVTKKTQTYKLSKIDGKDDCLNISVEKCRKYRNTLQEIFEGKVCSRKLDNQLVTILKKYDETSFDRAWDGLMDDQNFVEKSYKISAPDDNLAPQYLVIEEINRGNCAQIFGDLFQLLDRSDNGYSTYPIDADTDIKNAIKTAFEEEDDYKIDFLDIEDAVDDYTSNYDSTLSDDVKEGRVLLLPPNLYIWATMNTSDQSLFPIDSAFKRRWDWVYKPIGYKNDNWVIEIGEKKYKWVDFQKEINQRIFDIDNSEDKQLGDYFVNADHTNNIISANTLLNKILFYLWNDVCKDDPDHIFRWKDTDEKEKSIKFSEFFCSKEEYERKLQGFMSFLKVKYIGESESTAEPKAVEISKEENEEVNA